MSEIDFYHKPYYITELSKKFRKKQTNAEQFLREKLKWKQLNGWRFHRQKALFVYREESGHDRFLIADFYHHPKKLIIEVDGKIHSKKEVRDYDHMREYLLKENGYNIIRFTNEEIFNDIESVLQKITEKIKEITLKEVASEIKKDDDAEAEAGDGDIKKKRGRPKKAA